MTSRRAPKRRAEPSRASQTSSSDQPSRKGGKRAYRQRSHAAPSVKRSLPQLSMPLAAGATALVIAGVGAITFGPATGADSEGKDYPALSSQYAAAGLSGASRDPNVNAFDLSRDADRELLQQQVAQQAVQRRQAIRALAERTEKRAQNLKTQWVLPVAGYRLTARFGETSSLWSTVHTGLDFAAATGTQIVSVAEGTVTEAGYDGAYGERTVIALEDGTEIWYCHQTTIDVSVGQTVAPGDPIGTVGSTGNVTGPHLHLEVHPGGGDAVDPFTALQEHGVTP